MLRLSRVICQGSNLNNYFKNSVRTLYSLNSLGVDNYVEQRDKVKKYFLNDADKYREKMHNFLENEENSMIFTEDLKNMIHLADPVDSDLQLLEKMLRKFTQQSKEMRFGNFTFGPVVMRFFHHINNPDLALQLFKDPAFEGFFDQLISYQILVDMLYEHGRYQDVIDVFQVIRSRQIQGGMYPRHVVLLVFAACYKENTPESFKFSTDLWLELNQVGHIPMRRAITFAAALAIRQNAPHVALELVGTARQQQYVTVRNIKVLAFTDLGRADDALTIVKSVLQGNDSTTKQTFNKDVIDNLKEAVNKSGKSELVQNFNRIEKFLLENGHIVDKTLDDILTTEINSPTSQIDYGKDRTVLAASYNNNNRERNQNYGYKKTQQSGRYARPGLEDLS